MNTLVFCAFYNIDAHIVWEIYDFAISFLYFRHEEHSLKDSMIKGNGFFITTEIGGFHPTLSGDCRPTQTVMKKTGIVPIRSSLKSVKNDYTTMNV